LNSFSILYHKIKTSVAIGLRNCLRKTTDVLSYIINKCLNTAVKLSFELISACKATQAVEFAAAVTPRKLLQRNGYNISHALGSTLYGGAKDIGCIHKGRARDAFTKTEYFFDSGSQAQAYGGEGSFV